MEIVVTYVHLDATQWTNQMWIDYLQRGSDISVLLCTLEVNKVDHSLQDNVENLYNWTEYIYHDGSSHDCHSIIQFRFDCRRKRYERRETNGILHSRGSYE